MMTRSSLLLLCLSTTPALAGGLSLYENSPQNMGLANAGAAARAQDASTLASNPAGMSRLEGTQIQVNGGWVQGHLDAADGGNAVETAPLGSLYLTHEFDERWHGGVGLFGSHGLGLEYAPNWQGRYQSQEASLSGIMATAALSYRIDEQWSVGASLLASHGTVEAAKAVRLPGGDGQLTYEESDWAYGYMFGILYEPSQTSRLGLSYTSELEWKLQGEARLTPSSPRQPDKGLNQLGVDLTLPQTLTLSLYQQVNDRWALLASTNWQQWSRFGEVDVALLNGRVQQTRDLNYKDTWHLSLGTQFQATEALQLSTGIAYDSSPVEDADRSAALPLSAAWHLGLGADYRLTPTTRLSAGYSFVWMGDLSLDSSGILKEWHTSYDNSRLHFVNLGINHQF